MANKAKNIVHRRLIRSYLTSVISISLVLVLVAAAAFFAVNAGGVARWVKENMAVSVLLKQSVSEKEGRKLADELAARPYVRESRFISKEEGAEEMKALLGEDFLSVFESSPIPISVELKLTGEAITSDSLEVIKANLLQNRMVEEVVYQESLVETLNANLRRISLLLGVVIVLLMVISFALISNTVRLNIHTMSQVGARRSLIARPFVRQAVAQGAVAGLIASALLYAGIRLSGRGTPLLEALFDHRLMWVVLVGTVLLGIALCVLSTLVVVRRVAYLSKDDLYY